MFENCKNVKPIGRLEDPLFGSIPFYEMKADIQPKKSDPVPQEEQEK